MDIADIIWASCTILASDKILRNEEQYLFFKY